MDLGPVANSMNFFEIAAQLELEWDFCLGDCMRFESPLETSEHHSRVELTESCSPKHLNLGHFAGFRIDRKLTNTPTVHPGPPQSPPVRVRVIDADILQFCGDLARATTGRQ